MINVEADKFIRKLFDLLKNRYENKLESIKGSEFVLYYVHLLYYKCHKINLSRDGPYIDCPDWIRKQKNNNKSYQQKKKRNAFKTL